jgi:nucleoside-diphosphate-sugar epimerase
MRILITGINSALGAALADGLMGHEVIGLGRHAHPRHRTVLCDLRGEVPPLPAVDLCLHLACVTDPKYCSEHPAEAYRVNVSGTARLLGRARRFVLVSTGSVYGYQEGPLDEGRRPAPGDDYARLKWAAEREVAGHPDAAILRYFFPYGPGAKPGSLVNRLIRCVESGAAVELHEGGQPWVNPIYFTDVVAATRVVCTEGLRGIYNVAGNEVVSVRSLAERIGRMLGKQPRFRGSGKRVKDLVGDTGKLGKVFGPEVSLTAGLKATIEWLSGQRRGG